MDEIDLSQSYPEAVPIQSAPSLGSINGFGLALYGSRDADRVQGLHVKTLCITALFIPLISLRSYVVANAQGGGWYFLGKVPLSGFAKLMNIVVLIAALSVAGGISWSAYTGTAGYKAKQRLADGQSAEDRGAWVDAANHYQVAATSKTEHAGEGERRLGDLTDRLAQSGPTSELSVVLEVTVRHTRNNGGFADRDWVKTATDAVYQHRQDNPSDLLAVLDAVEPLVTETQRERWFNARIRPLEQMVKQDPSQIEAVSELSVAYESRGDMDKARELLMPIRDKLGTGEGARVLGFLLLGDGELAAGCKLLEGYADARINQLQSAEQAWNDAYQRASEQALSDLNEGKADEAWYVRYEVASEEQQGLMVDEYIGERLRGDTSVIQAREAYTEISGVVDVALSLGVAQLDLAQTQNNPTERKAMLKEAEQTFLSVQGSAGDSDQYRLYLGQVYFWLGRADEGQALFDKVLAESPGDSQTVSSVAYMLRLVGEVEKSIALYEKAYNTEQDQAGRYALAASLASMARDREIEVKWLKRCDPNDKQAQAELKNTLADEAAEQGKNDQALALYDEAIAIYDAMPESSSSLNNSALLLDAKFAVTGDLVDRDQSLDRLVRAVELEPSNTVLLRNTASSLLSAALYDLAAPHLDLRKLKIDGSYSTLRYIVTDEASWKDMTQKLQAMPRYNKALSMYERVTLLAPKNVDAYLTLLQIHGYLEDHEAIQELRDRAVAAQPDTELGLRMLRSRMEGKYDERFKNITKTKKKRLRTLIEESGLDTKTLAAAKSMLSSAILELHGLDQPADLDEAMRLAEDAWQTYPSQEARSSYNTASCEHALASLAKQHPEVGTMRDRLQRSHSSMTILALATEADEKVRATAKSDPSLNKLLAMREDHLKRFPDSSSTTTWALCRQIAPGRLPLEAKLVTEDLSSAVSRELQFLLTPYYAETIYRRAWAHEIDGQAEQAQRLIREYKARRIEP